MISLLENWYSSHFKRILASLGDTYKRSCDEAVNKMQRYRQDAQDYLLTASAGRVSDVLGLLAEAGLYSEARRHAGMPNTLSPPGLCVTQPNSRACSPAPSENEYDSSLDDSPGLEESWDPDWTKESIMSCVLPLQCYYQEERIKNLTARAKNLSVSREVYVKIHRWLTTANAEAIALEGPSGVTEPSQSTLTSAFVLRSVNQAQIPVIGHFCYYDPREWASYDRTEQLLHLVYSLIYQLALIIPEGTDADNHFGVDLSPSRLSCVLGGGVDHLDAAISLLGDLFKLAPPLLFCVVDGLRRVDSTSNPPALRSSVDKLLTMLCTTASKKTESNGALKVLISTNGSSLALREKERAALLKVIRDSGQANQDEPMRVHERQWPGKR